MKRAGKVEWGSRPRIVPKRELVPHAPPGVVRAIIQHRCPRCRKGIIFRNGSHMNNLCPVCGLRFDREPGYFTGSIFIGYFFAVPAALAFFLLFFYLFPDLDLVWDALLAMGGLIPLVPAIIRISRVIWMGLDRAIRPD